VCLPASAGTQHRACIAQGGRAPGPHAGPRAQAAWSLLPLAPFCHVCRETLRSAAQCFPPLCCAACAHSLRASTSTPRPPALPCRCGPHKPRALLPCTRRSALDPALLPGQQPPKSAAAVLASGRLLDGDESEEEEDILASRLAAVGREVKAASAAVFHDRMLFQVGGGVPRGRALPQARGLSRHVSMGRTGVCWELQQSCLQCQLCGRKRMGHATGPAPGTGRPPPTATQKGAASTPDQRPALPLLVRARAP